MSDTSPILHIGYPKTGTTWFQEHFYPKIPSLHLIDRITVFHSIAFTSIFEYSPVRTYETVNRMANGRRIVLCDEIMLGGLDIGWGNGEFLYTMATRLRNTFGEAKVVLILRNQLEALESAYSHYIKSGGTYSVEEFLGIKKRYSTPFWNHHLFNPRLFCYSAVRELYRMLFGEKNVYLFLYEDFRENPDGFIESFCKKLNIAISDNTFNTEKFPNKRLSPAGIKLRRIANHFVRGKTPFKHYILPIPGTERAIGLIEHALTSDCASRAGYTFSRRIREQLTDLYRSDNRILLDSLSEKKLKDYGYPL